MRNGVVIGVDLIFQLLILLCHFGSTEPQIKP